MTGTDRSVHVYLEIGKKKVVVGALEWPGWQRIGRSEDEALTALVDYGPRYGRLLPKSFDFYHPSSTSELLVVERMEGNATTDFGAPGLSPAYDSKPVDAETQEHFLTILDACWEAFDQAVVAAQGKTLKKGPRGGGRELEAIMEHVMESDRSYISSLGWKFRPDKTADLPSKISGCREAVIEGLAVAVQGEIATEGPRGGKRWSPRYFVRRTAWHTLDHVWEIEDRVED